MGVCFRKPNRIYYKHYKDDIYIVGQEYEIELDKENIDDLWMKGIDSAYLPLMENNKKYRFIRMYLRRKPQV